MSARIFDGLQVAAERETALAQRVATFSGSKPNIAAIVFTEDAGSVLYTRLKSEAAERVGIGYHANPFSLSDSVDVVCARIAELNLDPEITGIIVQKPRRQLWEASQPADVASDKSAYQHWWLSLTSALNPDKDVDGLHSSTLAAVEAGQREELHRVLPATVSAVFIALEASGFWQLEDWQHQQITILGKSDLLGTPLAAELKNRGAQVELLGRKEIEARMVNKSGAFAGSTVLVIATGQENLITGEMISEGSIVIDVGEPRPDVERASVEPKAAFLTPVPGGIGPLTVVSLLENAVELVIAAG